MKNYEKITKMIERLAKLERRKVYIEKSVLYLGCRGQGDYVTVGDIGAMNGLAESVKTMALHITNKEIASLKKQIDSMCLAVGIE